MEAGWRSAPVLSCSLFSSAPSFRCCLRVISRHLCMQATSQNVKITQNCDAWKKNILETLKKVDINHFTYMGQYHCASSWLKRIRRAVSKLMTLGSCKDRELFMAHPKCPRKYLFYLKTRPTNKSVILTAFTQSTSWGDYEHVFPEQTLWWWPDRVCW